MELFSKKTLAIATGVFSIYYAASTFIGGLGVDVVVTEPEECSLVKNLLPVRYTENRFLTALVQKERAKKAGGDTVYLPIGVSNISSSQGYISGAAYDCSQVK